MENDTTGKLVIWIGFHHPVSPNHSAAPDIWKSKTLVTRYGLTKQEARELAQNYQKANPHIKGIHADWSPYPEILQLD